jgi:hypothetical protein
MRWGCPLIARNNALRVSANRRFLTDAGGSPFFYLGDTAWELFHRLTREDARQYLEDRAAKGFTVIQAVVISEFEGLSDPNAYGDLPLHDGDPTRPNDAYFRHVDWIVERAAELGMHVGMLPTWGDKVGPVNWGTGPEVFTVENAAVYGRFLGERYRDAPIIWILGGDRNPTTSEHIATWCALAEGLAAGDGGTHLRTFHPQGRSSSAAFVHDEEWLDFNTIQSGHHELNGPNHQMIDAGYNRTPVKPILDAEPCYEDHPVNWKPDLGHFSDWDARKAAYWSLFAGSCGHTYGANSIFQFWTGGDPGKFGARRPWQDALDLPGSGQMRHARALIESRPVFDRVPDQSLIASGVGTGEDHVRATRASDYSYAFVYLPKGQPVTIDLSRFPSTPAASWFDPRTGESRSIGTAPDATFSPPSSGLAEDWVLVLDCGTS